MAANGGRALPRLPPPQAPARSCEAPPRSRKRLNFAGDAGFGAGGAEPGGDLAVKRHAAL